MPIKKMIPSIPRAIYYMSPKTSVTSFFKLIFKSPTFDKVELFETSFSKYVDCPYSIATSHARFALYLSLKSYEFPKDSEVLLTGINLPDMINMIRLNNLNPVCIDYENESFNISCQDIEQKITKNTKAIFITILSGIIPNLDSIYELARKNNLIVIQDLTQAFYLKKSGRDIASLADISIYSLCDLKDIHSHRGGMIVTSDEGIYKKIKQAREACSLPPQKKYFLQFVIEDFVSSIILRRKFFHLFIYPILKWLYSRKKIEAIVDLTKGKGIKLGHLNIGRGLWGGDGDLVRFSIPDKLKYTYTDLQAEIGLLELKKVIGRIEKRAELSRLLAENLDHNLLPFNFFEKHSFWKFPIKVDNLKIWQEKLLELGIDAAATNLPNLAELDCFKHILKNELKNTPFLTNNILYIPVHYYLTHAEVYKVAEIINYIYNSQDELKKEV